MNETSNFDPVIDLANEYLERYRRGEDPAVEEYEARRPDLAEQIRDVFPMMLLMEDNAPDESGSPGNGQSASAPKLERLGDFRIIREIGRGGMGIVYEAVQESLGRHVALKVFPGHAQLNPRHQERFKRESRSAAMLHHTNIVPVFSVGNDNGMLYYVMQYIRGAGLDEVIAELVRLRPSVGNADPRTRTRPGSNVLSQVAQSLTINRGPGSLENSPTGSIDGKPTMDSRTISGRDSSVTSGVHLPGQSENAGLSDTGKEYWQSVARIGVQVAQALDYAHTQGTLHRDIKPSNLLLDQDATVWVTDFGLAKSREQDDLTHTGELVGTFRYMPPEQFAGDSDERSDLYSLGLTLYELATLRPAFDMPDRQKLMRAITESEPPQPRKLNSDIPRDLETIILKTIEREPSRRYQTAGELAADLSRFLNNEPLWAKPVNLFDRILKWGRRRPAIAGLLVALALLFCVSFGLVTWKWREAELARAAVKVERDDARKAETAERSAKLRETRERERKEELLKESEQNLYYNQIAQANLQLGQNDIQDAEQTLLSAGEQLRGWEWRYLHGQLTPEVMTLDAGTDAAPWIYCLGFSSDGKYLATGSGVPDFAKPEIGAAGAARIWDLASGKKTVDFEDRTQSVVGIAFSPDGKRLAVCDYDIRGRNKGLLRIWDIATRTELVRMRDENQQEKLPIILNLKFSPDGKFLLGKRRSGIRAHGINALDHLYVWDVETGDSLWNRRITNVSFQISENSREVNTLIDGQWGDIDLETGLVIRQYEQKPGYPDPSGRFIFTWKAQNAPIRDVESGEIQHTIRDPQGGMSTFSMRPDCGRVATAGLDGAIREWDLASGSMLQLYQGHSSQILSLQFSDSGRYLASGDWKGKAKIWKTLDNRRSYGSHRFVSDSVGRIEDMSFRIGDGALVLITTAGQLQTRETQTGDLVNEHLIDISIPVSGPVRTAAFDGGGNLLAGSGGQDSSSLKIWDVESGKEKMTFSGHQQPNQHMIYRVAFSLNGNRVAAAAGNIPAPSADKQGELNVWDVADNGNSGQASPLLTISKQGVYFTGVALSPDGETLAACEYFPQSASKDLGNTPEYLLTVRDVRSGSTTILPPPDAPVRAITFSDDGKTIAAGAGTGLIKLFNSASGKTLSQIRGPDGLEDLAFSPDGRRLAGVTRLATRVWDTTTGHEVIILRSELRHGDPIFNPTVLFSPDGNQLVSSKWHGKYSFMIWSSEPGREEGTNGYWKKPIDNVTELVDAHPDNASYRLSRGRFFSAAEKTESARQDFIDAARLAAQEDGIGLNLDRPSYIETGHVPFDQFPSFTVEAWVRDWSGFLVYQTEPMRPGIFFNESAGVFCIRRNDESGYKFKDGAEYNQHAYRVSFAAEPAVTGWTHLAVVRDGDRIFSFSNGKLISTVDNVPASGPLNRGQPLWIGGIPASHSLQQDSGRGFLRSFRISKTARYQSEFTPQAKLAVDDDAILLYDFSRLEDQLNADVKDLSDSHNDGRLLNAWWLDD